MMLILHHIALGLHNSNFSASRVQFFACHFFKVKMGILAHVVHPDSQVSYAPYFEVAGFCCGIRFSSNRLHSRLPADGSVREKNNLLNPFSLTSCEYLIESDHVHGPLP